MKPALPHPLRLVCSNNSNSSQNQFPHGKGARALVAPVADQTHRDRLLTELGAFRSQLLPLLLPHNLPPPAQRLCSRPRDPSLPLIALLPEFGRIQSRHLRKPPRKQGRGPEISKGALLIGRSPAQERRPRDNGAMRLRLALSRIVTTGHHSSARIDVRHPGQLHQHNLNGATVVTSPDAERAAGTTNPLRRRPGHIRCQYCNDTGYVRREKCWRCPAGRGDRDRRGPRWG